MVGEGGKATGNSAVQKHKGQSGSKGEAVRLARAGADLILLAKG